MLNRKQQKYVLHLWAVLAPPMAVIVIWLIQLLHSATVLERGKPSH
ncbi:hypothetical protein CLOSTMETH_00935 [[Clostridium] methylpentosum DSM 5476]|uniref:Uncharacterized protein n=1 Tax=[Clostridium] methylpentosum DSM 5476 TaxID=537013 RepID=C0EAS1_9FIRM|nr:hypothetical protein CLOSTMETH_00935 [[Clostridium] methylpentosum DSM 5476]